MNISKKNVFILSTLVIFSLTPFYGLSYLIAVYFFSKQVNYSKVFDTIFSKLVLSTIILSVVVMITGTIAWLTKLQTYPILVLIIFAAVSYLFKNDTKKNATSSLFNKADLISLLLSVLLIPVIIFSFYLPKFESFGSLQILTNGNDNTEHFSLLQTNSDENGYVYGPKEEVLNKTITPLNAYPQGWHLATSHLLNGFGVKLFQSDKPLLALNMYLVALIATYVTALYTVTLLMWRIFQLHHKKRSETWDDILVFSSANIIIQLLLYWGSLLLGFASFLGCLIYFAVIISAITDKGKYNYLTTLSVACLGAFAITQTWLLPLPAVLGTIALGFVINKKSLTNIKRLLYVKKYIGVRAVLPLALVLFGALFQVYIFIRFSTMSTSDAINNDGGVFWISNILLGIITFFTIHYWMSKHNDQIISDKFIAAVAPVAFLCGAIFIYQLLSEGRTSYYFVKSLGIMVCMIGIFFVPAFTETLRTISAKSKLPLAGTLLSISILSTLLTSTGQTTLALNGFIQRNSKVTSEIANEVENYLENYDVKSTRLVVLGGENTTEDYVATFLANRTAHIPNLCEIDISPVRYTLSKAEKINRLKNCANKNPKTVVITSNYTYDAVRAINNPNLIIVNVP